MGVLGYPVFSEVLMPGIRDFLKPYEPDSLWLPEWDGAFYPPLPKKQQRKLAKACAKARKRRKKIEKKIRKLKEQL